MKFPRLSIFLHEISLYGARNGCQSNFYSSKAIPSHTFIGPLEGSMTELYRRISPIEDQRVSIVPILDHWVEEGRSVNQSILKRFLRELRFLKRYRHALEISTWLTNKRYSNLTSSDVATRLDLITKVLGIEQAEKYFNNVPQNLKGIKVYDTLLKCYATAKCVEKAEALMQNMRDLGFAYQARDYNVMLTLYAETGNMEKFNTLLKEMEENGIVHDKFTLAIQLSAYATVMDSEGMDNIVRNMESDPNIDPDWTNYYVAATGYRKAGLIDRALEMLKKAETFVGHKKMHMYNSLLSQYAAIGLKDEVLRVWSLYKKNGKVYNNGYMRFLESLMKLGDFEMAENILDEWESHGLTYDMNVPNIMVDGYSRNLLLEEAEAVIDRAIAKGGQPNALTWYYLARGYLEKDQPQKAVEMMKQAIMLWENWETSWKPDNKYLAACLEHLKGVGDMEEAEDFIKLMLNRSIISLDIQEKLLNAFKAKK